MGQLLSILLALETNPRAPEFGWNWPSLEQLPHSVGPPLPFLSSESAFCPGECFWRAMGGRPLCKLNASLL